MQDIIKFNQVNKKCGEAIATVFINPFRLSEFHPFSLIKKVFPSIQTYYCYKCFSCPKKVEANEMPLMEIGNWDKGLPTTVLATQWFCEKIKKMKITAQTYRSFMSNSSKFTNLQIISIEEFHCDLEKLLEVVLSLSTVQKVFLYCNYWFVANACIKRAVTMASKCQITFVFTSFSLNQFSDDDLNDLPSNIKVYFPTKHFGEQHYLICGMLNSNHMYNKKFSFDGSPNYFDGFEEMAKEAQKLNPLSIRYRDYAQRKAIVDFSVFDQLTKLSLEKTRCTIKFPPLLKKLKLTNVKGELNEGTARLKILKIGSKGSLSGTLHIDDLTTFVCHYCTCDFKVVKNGKKTDFEINEQFENLSLDHCRFTKVQLSINGHIVDSNRAITIKNGKRLTISSSNPDSILDLSTFNFRKVNISDSDFKEIRIGNVDGKLSFGEKQKQKARFGIVIAGREKITKIKTFHCGVVGSINKEQLICEDFQCKKVLNENDSGSEEGSEDSISEEKKPKKKTTKKAKKVKKVKKAKKVVCEGSEDCEDDGED